MDSTNGNLAICSAFAEEFARLGVGLTVISPGSRSTPLAVAFDRQEGIETFVGIDERASSFLALGAAQATRTPVVLVCTSGTAAANYLPAVAEADLSAVPLIVLTADRPPELRGIGAGQVIDQIKIYGDAVRLFVEVGNHEADDHGLIHARSLACRSFAASAGDPRPGPVHLNFGLREPLAPVSEPDQVTGTLALALEGRGDDLPLTSVISPPVRPEAIDLAPVIDLLQGREKPMIIAGRQLDPTLAEPVMRLAECLDAPVLAEPTSQLRSGSHPTGRVIWRYDSILANGDIIPDLTPDAVIRIGEIPTSKALRQMLGSSTGCAQILIDPTRAWNDPTELANLILRTDPGVTLELLTGLLTAVSGGGFTDRWLDAQERSLEPEPGNHGLDRAAIHRTVFECAGGGIVYTASSLAIRDQERESPIGSGEILYLANRGANGIDGLVSSGIGAALATGRRTTVVTGDVGFRHDSGALDLLAGLDLDIRVLVINDGGGRIFEKLPQKASMEPGEFDRLMLTPGSVEPSVLAAAWDIPATRVDDVEALEEALLHTGPLVIEACPAPESAP